MERQRTNPDPAHKRNTKGGLMERMRFRTTLPVLAAVAAMALLATVVAPSHASTFRHSR